MLFHSWLWFVIINMSQDCSLDMMIFCKRIYIVGSQIFDEVGNIEHELKQFFVISLDPKIVLLTPSTLQLCVPTC